MQKAKLKSSHREKPPRIQLFTALNWTITCNNNRQLHLNIRCWWCDVTKCGGVRGISHLDYSIDHEHRASVPHSLTQQQSSSLSHSTGAAMMTSDTHHRVSTHRSLPFRIHCVSSRSFFYASQFECFVFGAWKSRDAEIRWEEFMVEFKCANMCAICLYIWCCCWVYQLV